MMIIMIGVEKDMEITCARENKVLNMVDETWETSTKLS
jgi:hypothetical protein